MIFQKFPLSAFFISLFILALFLFSCQKSAPTKVNPEQVFSQVESALRKHYIHDPEGVQTTIQADFMQNYKAALSSLIREVLPNNGIFYKNSVLDRLGRHPVLLKKIKQPLYDFIQALPTGINSVSFPTTQSSKGKGIGIILKHISQKFLIVDVLEGSGAFRAGLQPGRVITKVDGLSLAVLTLPETVGLIRGKKYTFTHLDFQTGKALDVERGDLEYRPMQVSRWNSNKNQKTLYLMPRSVNAEIIGRIRALIQKEGRPDIVVLDLRKLFDGNFISIFEMSDLFLKQGVRASIQLRSGATKVLESDVESIFNSSLYIIYSKESSASALFCAWLLQHRLLTFGIGPRLPINAFVQKEIAIGSGIRLNITSGAVHNSKGQALYLQKLNPAFFMLTGLPKNPPLDAPDPTDPAQSFLARKLNIVPN